ncbi:hypothetical protein Pla175_31710 [Pirellulimonas nuda]|uniref:Ice-binding protein C-terminal domain-containing protein n=1 Tax=Pirellulimonas nuda TaxID=2528009 RepID=A0A518DE84_9BACT|nr:PEP-CTERM sorting domain-containing protein [Pirellulimonas nuda]QDU89776.1 hypothetical protein Pla175_31710 [Pirellulimonas nuda]
MIRRSLVFSGVIALMPAISSAAVILDDTFADGSRGETSLPNESAVWASHAGGVTMGAGSLAFNQTTSSGSQKLWTHFAADGAEIELAVGDQLIATIDFTPRVALYDNSSTSFRFGLFNDPTDPQVASDTNSDGGGSGAPWTDSTGYAVQIALTTGATASNNASVGKRTDQANSSLLGSSGAYTSTSGGAQIVNVLDTQYTMTLALTRSAADVMDVAFSIADAGGVISTHSITDDPNGVAAFGTGPIATKFEQLFFRFSNNTTTADVIDFGRFKIEHVQGQAVPEPASLALLGLCGAAAVAVRRRKSM